MNFFLNIYESVMPVIKLLLTLVEWGIVVILSLLGLLVLFLQSYQLYLDCRGTHFHSFWIFWHKMKFKTYDFFSVTYYESDDHLWDGSKECYLVAKPNELLIEWDYPVFHKRLILQYDRIDSICFSVYKKDIDFPFPPDNLNDFLDIREIWITNINNVTYYFKSGNEYGHKHLFFKGGNFFKALCEKAPQAKITFKKYEKKFI